MIDLLIGIALGAGGMAAIHHFRKSTTAIVVAPNLDLEAVLEATRHLVSEATGDLAKEVKKLSDALAKP